MYHVAKRLVNVGVGLSETIFWYMLFKAVAEGAKWAWEKYHEES